MKKVKHIITAIGVFIVCDAFGQQCTNPTQCSNTGQCANITVTSPNTNNCNLDYSARDYIKFKPGFSYKAQNGKKLHAWLDEGMILPITYNTDVPTTASRPFDSSLPVATTLGFADVNQIGGAIYTIPIYIPPGTNGIQPNISLLYNSQSGNGIAGWGWNIGGLSMIMRTQQTLYNNNQIIPLNLTGTDRFALDGNLLIEDPGSTYGADNTVYHTELETFNKIISKGTAGLGPEWFEMQTKEGLILEYGNSADSRFVDENGTNVLFWRINKVRDSHGNYVEYIYNNSNRESRIVEIKYTGNTNLAPYNSLKFYYAERDDKNETWVAGHSVKNELVLRKIRVVVEGKNIKEYELKYHKGFSYKPYSMLSEVREKGEQQEINSTIFEYGTEGAAFQSPATSGLQKFESDDQIITGDFNGDGLTDIVRSKKQFSTSGNYFYNTGYQLYLNTGSSFSAAGQINFSGGQNLIGYNSEAEVWMYGALGTMSSDFNGDGLDDIIIVDFEEGDWKLNKFRIYYSDGNSFPAHADYPPVNTNFNIIFSDNESGFTVLKNYLFTGDFDGDGATDFITFLGNGTTFKAFIYYPRIGTSEEIDIFSFFPSIPSFPTDITPVLVGLSKIRVLDFNGDGKQDLMGTFGDNTNIFGFHKSSFAATTNVELLYSGNYPTAEHRVFIGDFNGDGKSDLLTTKPDEESKIAYSRGYDFFTKSVTTGGRVLIGDYNGDGKTDILGIEDWGAESRFRLTLGTGTDILFMFNHIGSMHNKKYPEAESPLFVGDFNGDGKQDILTQEQGGSSPHFFYFGINGRDHLLYKTANGLNFLTTFNYSSIVQDAYNKGTGASYPVLDYKKPLYVVSSATTPDGIGGTSTSNINYEEAKYHMHGKGFLGFSKITSINNNTGITQQSEFEQIPLQDIVAMVPKSNKIFSGTLLQSTYTNTGHVYGNKRFFPYVSNIESEDFLRDQTVTSTYTYNTDGNLTNSTVNYGTAETESSTYTYVQKGSWLPNRIQTQTVTKTRDGDSYSVSNFYDYYSDGKIKELKVFNGLAKEVKTEYVYNGTGNLTKTTVSSPGLASRISQYEYDSKGRFATKVTNPLNQFAEAQYDPRWGTPLMQKGADGLITTYEYDNFGALTKMKTPDNIEADYSRDFVTSAVTGPGGTALPALYSASVQRTGSPSSTTYYDVYGRELKTQTEGLSQTVNIVQTYNNKGQLAMQSAPYFDGETPSISTYSYFTSGLKAGLLSTINNSMISGNTSYDYSDFAGIFTSTVTNPAGQTSSQKTDAAGKVVEAADVGGTLTYSYYGTGKLKEVKKGSQQLAFIEYDDFARQKKLTDPNAGTIEYDYNAFGELIFQEDARNNSYSMQYDLLGRITTKTGPDGNTTWQYVPSGSAINQVQSITAPSGIIQNFGYDNLGRMTSITENIGGLPITTQYAYDQFSRISQITYPSGFKLAKNYNNKGYLTQVNDATSNAMIWQGQQMNALGQFTKYKQGNNIITENTFNSLGMLEAVEAGNIHDLQLDWNLSNGNLNFRKDYTTADILKETFTYDNLNRLTSSTISGTANPPQPISVAYNSLGNITNKTGIGIYNYDPAKINAVNKTNDVTGDFVSIETQTIEYTTFNKTSKITEEEYEMNLTYGSDNQRRKTELKNNGVVEKTIIYNGNYEKITTASGEYEVCYFGGNAVSVKHNGNFELFYFYTDHLGSILKITNTTGAVIYEQNFDAWGHKRNPDDWSYDENTSAKPEWLIRGFTGHEHLDEFALINMNGRVYDPVIGRMNAPDNFVQNPFGTQGYNRYSYALNNPLVYTDPDGEFPVFLIPIAIGFVAGAYTGAAIQQHEAWAGNWNWQDQNMYKAMAVGGIIGAGVGAGFAAGMGYAGTGFAASGFGASSAAWTITSNALITANVNIALSFAQGRGLDGAWKSGLIGLGAGAIGGTIGVKANSATKLPMATNAVKLMNYTTAGFNGFSDRMILSYEKGDRGWDLWRNGLVGAGEGLLMANLGNNDKILNVSGPHRSIIGRYISSSLIQAGTSVPGLGLTLYSYYAIGQSGIALTKFAGIAGPWITYVGHPLITGVANEIMGENYPAKIRPKSLWDFME